MDLIMEVFGKFSHDCVMWSRFRKDTATQAKMKKQNTKKNKEKMENGQVMIGDAVFEHNPNLW